MIFLLAPDIRPARAHKLDLGGELIVTAALFCIAFGLQEGERYAWHTSIVAPLVAGVLIGLFVLHQKHPAGGRAAGAVRALPGPGLHLMTITVALISVAILGLTLPLDIYSLQHVGA